jgi:hypothetical protein
MTRMLDCLVTYFGLDESERPGYRRYYCYHVLAGPGPTPGAGVAVIRTLAVHRENERCTSCEHFHTVETGGPEAALAAALRHLDAYHGQDHVRKVQSDLRPCDGDPGTRVAPPPARAEVAATLSERGEP